MNSKYHMIEKCSRDLGDVPTGREMLVIFAIWFAVMFGLAMSTGCSSDARAELRDPPVILGILTKDRVASPKSPKLYVRQKPVDPATVTCFSPEGPVPDRTGVLLQDPPTDEERRMIEIQLEHCKRDVRGVADPFLMLAVLRFEEEIGVPDEARGILNAVWCIEAAMKLEDKDGGPIRGDWHGGHANAHGPAQLWSWHRNWCGLAEGGADDLYASLGCYWQRAEDRREKRAMGCIDTWRVGEALAANGIKYKPHGCKAQSSHWKEMKKWHRILDETDSIIAEE